MDLFDYLIFALAGFLGAFIDAIAGGGGLICIPTLFAMGLDPVVALGTNKLQGFLGTFIASLNYYKKGLAKFEISGIFFTFIGSIFGVFLLLKTNPNYLKILTPIFLSIVFIYTLFNPNLKTNKAIIKKEYFFIIFGLILGFYDGFFGAGTGSFWTFALIYFLGLNLKNAIANAKILNLTSNISALFIFLLKDEINYKVAFVMIIGQIIGAILGSNLVIKKDVKFIRYIFLTIVAITILKIFYDFFKKV